VAPRVSAHRRRALTLAHVLDRKAELEAEDIATADIAMQQLRSGLTRKRRPRGDGVGALLNLYSQSG
jgi:hypothetical protein